MKPKKCKWFRLHRVEKIEVSGKIDAVTISCGCGAEEYIGTWYHRLPGWHSRHWDKLMQAAHILSVTFHNSHGAKYKY